MKTIKYEIDTEHAGEICTTKCPYGKDMFVGDSSCTLDCGHFISDNESEQQLTCRGDECKK